MSCVYLGLKLSSTPLNQFTFLPRFLDSFDARSLLLIGDLNSNENSKSISELENFNLKQKKDENY